MSTPAGPDERDRRRWQIVDLLRRYGTDAAAVGHAFGALHGLQPSDLQALVAVMTAELRRAPLNPSDLRRVLGLSSAGTSYVIDRLERAGHVVRERSDEDRRVVRLRYTDQGMATGLAFFGSLGDRANSILDQFGHDELKIIHKFIGAMADSMRDQVKDLEARP